MRDFLKLGVFTFGLIFLAVFVSSKFDQVHKRLDYFEEDMMMLKSFTFMKKLNLELESQK